VLARTNFDVRSVVAPGFPVSKRYAFLRCFGPGRRSPARPVDAPHPRPIVAPDPGSVCTGRRRQRRIRDREAGRSDRRSSPAARRR